MLSHPVQYFKLQRIRVRVPLFDYFALGNRNHCHPQLTRAYPTPHRPITPPSCLKRAQGGREAGSRSEFSGRVRSERCDISGTHARRESCWLLMQKRETDMLESGSRPVSGLRSVMLARVPTVCCLPSL
ncbi:hypothetical protein RRG08_031215 [Elysia crispata]|uniref:Uncharacterized protein n=1 Tax=Elysia crispata TaxID=231223 RepID=A0AAE1CJ76_9GAST|nr:hypothetical protein RRG08_031215 [Elysia crispata]